MATKRKVARKSVPRKSARLSGPDAQMVLLKEMFAALLLLQGVGQRSVAAIVAMDNTRISDMARLLSQKARAAK